jgi:hypothetical protein
VPKRWTGTSSQTAAMALSAAEQTDFHLRTSFFPRERDAPRFFCLQWSDDASLSCIICFGKWPKFRLNVRARGGALLRWLALLGRGGIPAHIEEFRPLRTHVASKKFRRARL